MLSNNRSASFVFYHGIYLFFSLLSFVVLMCKIGVCITAIIITKQPQKNLNVIKLTPLRQKKQLPAYF